MLLRCDRCKRQYDPRRVVPVVEPYHNRHFDTLQCRVDFINAENRRNEKQLELRLEPPERRAT